MLLGTIFNVITVILGSILGLIVKERLDERYKKIVFQGIGIFVIILGIQMGMKFNNILAFIFSILIGSIIGEALSLEDRFEKLTDIIKGKLKLKHDKFTDGVMAAFLLYCMGSMVILGTIEEGISGKHDLLFTKSIMDGFASIALASTYGIGVLFSVVPLFIYQASLTIFASFFKGFMTTAMIEQMSAVGGVLIIGLGLNLLELKRVKVMNMLPSLVIVVLLTILFSYIK